MTKSKKLNQFLKKVLHLSRNDTQSSYSRRLSSSSSEVSRDSSQERYWCSSHRSWESATSECVECEDEYCWSSPAHDLPAGSLPVYVGRERRRFVIPTSYLSNGTFKALLAKSEEEYGLRSEGGLRIACSPDDFEHFLWWLEGGTARVERTCSDRSGYRSDSLSNSD